MLKAAVAQVIYRTMGADQQQLDRVRDQLMALTKGWKASRVRQLVQETVDEIISPIVYAEALVLMDDHRREGREVVIVSSAPEEVVRPMARYLGVDHVIASRSAVDEEGRYAGELAFYATGTGKAKAIGALAGEWGLDLARCFAYSDSATDLPMLEAVGHPVAVNPDRDLRDVAEEREWPVVEFARPVTLRTRLATLPRTGAGHLRRGPRHPPWRASSPCGYSRAAGEPLRRRRRATIRPGGVARSVIPEVHRPER